MELNCRRCARHRARHYAVLEDGLQVVRLGDMAYVTNHCLGLLPQKHTGWCQPLPRQGRHPVIALNNTR